MRQKKEAGAVANLPPHLKVISESVRNENQDVAHEILHDELAPVVRDALTEDVLRGISDMVALTPTIVEKIKEDLESDDANIRQKAYTLVAKYTIGHPAIVRPPDEGATGNLVVNFGLPRPGDAVEHVESDISLEADEVKPCDMCGIDKSITHFVAGSGRCQQCFDEQQAQAKEMIGSGN